MMENYQLLDQLLRFANNKDGWCDTVSFSKEFFDGNLSQETIEYLAAKLSNDGFAQVNKHTEIEYGIFLNELGLTFLFEGGYTKREEDKLKREKYEYEKYFLEVEALKGQISKFRFDKWTTRASIIISFISILIAIIALCISA